MTKPITHMSLSATHMRPDSKFSNLYIHRDGRKNKVTNFVAYSGTLRVERVKNLFDTWFNGVMVPEPPLLYLVTPADSEMAEAGGWDSLEDMLEDLGLEDDCTNVFFAGETTTGLEQIYGFDNVHFIGIDRFPHAVPVAIDHRDNMWMTESDFEEYST